MAEALDVYADQFQVNTNPYGCSLNFLVSPPTPPAPGAPPQPQLQATIRMSLEHLKMMAFILHRQVKQHEEGTGTSVPLPLHMLNALQIGLEDWNGFWQ